MVVVHSVTSTAQLTVVSLGQAYDCWKSGVDPIEYAKDHKEFARAFKSFPHDADKIFPEWREKLGVINKTVFLSH
ncbi:hypothetical protein THIOSC13_1010004 [uncultured Thiomicrorhabdus sp.]